MGVTEKFEKWNVTGGIAVGVALRGVIATRSEDGTGSLCFALALTHAAIDTSCIPPVSLPDLRAFALPA